MRAPPPDRRPPPIRAVGYLLLARDAVPLPDGDWPVLLDALGAHSPTIEPDLPVGCWLALRAGRRGPTLRDAGAALLATAREWGHADARIGIAPTPNVARLATWWGSAPLTELAAADVPGFLAPLLPRDVGVGDEAADRLALVGLHTLGTIASLPRGALGDYLGTLGPALERLVRGEDDRPLVPARPPLVLAAKRALEWALDDRSQLAALVARLLAPLVAELRRRGLGATRVTLTLARAEGAPVVVTARLSSPVADDDCLLRQLLDDLPSTPVGDELGEQGVTALSLTLSAPRPLVGRQASFFDVPQGREARLQKGVAEARRRATGDMGYLHPVDLTHPLRSARYQIVAPSASPEGP